MEAGEGEGEGSCGWPPSSSSAAEPGWLLAAVPFLPPSMPLLGADAAAPSAEDAFGQLRGRAGPGVGRQRGGQRVERRAWARSMHGQQRLRPAGCGCYALCAGAACLLECCLKAVSRASPRQTPVASARDRCSALADACIPASRTRPPPSAPRATPPSAPHSAALPRPPLPRDPSSARHSSSHRATRLRYCSPWPRSSATCPPASQPCSSTATPRAAGRRPTPGPRPASLGGNPPDADADAALPAAPSGPPPPRPVARHAHDAPSRAARATAPLAPTNQPDTARPLRSGPSPPAAPLLSGPGSAGGSAGDSTAQSIKSAGDSTALEGPRSADASAWMGCGSASASPCHVYLREEAGAGRCSHVTHGPSRLAVLRRTSLECVESLPSWA